MSGVYTSRNGQTHTPNQYTLTHAHPLFISVSPRGKFIQKQANIKRIFGFIVRSISVPPRAHTKSFSRLFARFEP